MKNNVLEEGYNAAYEDELYNKTNLSGPQNFKKKQAIDFHSTNSKSNKKRVIFSEEVEDQIQTRRKTFQNKDKGKNRFSLKPYSLRFSDMAME